MPFPPRWWAPWAGLCKSPPAPSSYPCIAAGRSWLRGRGRDWGRGRSWKSTVDRHLHLGIAPVASLHLCTQSSQQNKSRIQFSSSTPKGFSNRPLVEARLLKHPSVAVPSIFQHRSVARTNLWLSQRNKPRLKSASSPFKGFPGRLWQKQSISRPQGAKEKSSWRRSPSQVSKCCGAFHSQTSKCLCCSD